jgi:hypothetical protein
VGEVLAVVAGRVVPAAVGVDPRALEALEADAAVGPVLDAVAALALEVGDHVGNGVTLEQVACDNERE